MNFIDNSAERADTSGLSFPSLSGEYAFLVLIPAGGLLWWLDQRFAATMPVWGPWDFSWSWFLSATVGLWWYGRGLTLLAPQERPAAWRTASFVAGVVIVYAVLQTHFEYLAEHMFFLNRAQHVAMHHLGPFFIALAWPGAALKRGMPAAFRRLSEAPPLVRLINILQQPVLATALFVGLVALWLIPPLHFRAMIDPRLYLVMNWSMVADGVLFWALVLDPRPEPPARVSFGGRAAMAFVVIPPQIMLGAAIAFSDHDIYSFYDWCGRMFPSINALADQQIGGLNIWIPPAMMSIVAFILVMNAMRLAEESTARTEGEDDDPEAISAGGWTGR